MKRGELVVFTKGRYRGKAAVIRHVLDFYDPPIYYVQLQIDVRVGQATADYVYNVTEDYLLVKGWV